MEIEGEAMETENFMLPLAEVERQHVLGALIFCAGNRTHTADILKISLRGLRDKLRQYEKSGFYVCKPIRGPQKLDDDDRHAASFEKSHPKLR